MAFNVRKQDWRNGGLKPNDYKIIGSDKGLKGKTLTTYQKFMSERFPNESSVIYAKEWATRFKRGEEWNLSDGQSRKILLKHNPSEYAWRKN